LSDKCWKLVFSDGDEKRRHETIGGGAPYGVGRSDQEGQEKFGLSSEAKAVSCYTTRLHHDLPRRS
jgi:hypothetical protein